MNCENEIVEINVATVNETIEVSYVGCEHVLNIISKPSIDPGNYDLSDFQNQKVDYFTKVSDVLNIVNLNKKIAWHKFENNISWCGIAVEGSLETDPVWKVTRIEVAPNGTTTSCVYEDVAVSDYLLLPVCGSNVNAYEFKQRVLTDNGLFEAQTCLINFINTFQ